MDHIFLPSSTYCSILFKLRPDLFAVRGLAEEGEDLLAEEEVGEDEEVVVFGGDGEELFEGFSGVVVMEIEVALAVAEGDDVHEPAVVVGESGGDGLKTKLVRVL